MLCTIKAELKCECKNNPRNLLQISVLQICTFRNYKLIWAVQSSTDLLCMTTRAARGIGVNCIFIFHTQSQKPHKLKPRVTAWRLVWFHVWVMVLVMTEVRFLPYVINECTRRVAGEDEASVIMHSGKPWIRWANLQTWGSPKPSGCTQDWIMVPDISIEAGGEIGAEGITWGCEDAKPWVLGINVHA